MLNRTLEPEVMASDEEAIAYDDMDHRAVNESFVQDLLALGDAQGEALDLGTGTARIPLLLCDQTQNLRVVAMDLSASMLDLARINIELSPHLDRIMLSRQDAKALEFADNRFDVVMSNSIVHHIPDPASAFAEAVRVCKSGGRLFFRDLSRPASEKEVVRLVETYAGDDTPRARQMFDDSLRAALTVEEVQALVSELGFSVGTVKATSDRHWTWDTSKQ